jgi:VIT1/CCC1 family predicted Fe2+/Mn2+ transporter
MPLAIVLLAPVNGLSMSVSVGSLVLLALLGAVGAWIGGAPILKPTLRVTFWGALAMAATAVIGSLVGTVV